MVVWTASSCTAYTRPPGWLHGRRHVEVPFHVSHDTTARPMGSSPFSARAGTPCVPRRRGGTARSESSPHRRARGRRRRPAVVWRQGWGRTVHPRPMTLLGQRPFARPSPRALRGCLLALRKTLKFSPVFPCFPHHEKHRGRCPQKRLSPPPPPRSRPSSIRPAVVRARFRPRERRTWHQPEMRPDGGEDRFVAVDRDACGLWSPVWRVLRACRADGVERLARRARPTGRGRQKKCDGAACEIVWARLIVPRGPYREGRASARP